MFTRSLCFLVYGLLSMAAGCGGTTSTLRVWGTVNYQGHPVEQGQIVFFPIESTPGPSTGTSVARGHYDLAARCGLRAGGIYRVEITAAGPQAVYSPNASGVGPMATVRKQILPPRFNQQSTLRVTISADPSQNRHDFELK